MPLSVPPFRSLERLGDGKEEWPLVRRQSKVAFRSVRVGASDRDGYVSDVSQITACATSYAERARLRLCPGCRFEPTEAVGFAIGGIILQLQAESWNSFWTDLLLW